MSTTHTGSSGRMGRFSGQPYSQIPSSSASLSTWRSQIEDILNGRRCVAYQWLVGSLPLARWASKCYISWVASDDSLPLHCVAIRHKKSIPGGLSQSPLDPIPIYSSLEIAVPGTLLLVTLSQVMILSLKFKFSALHGTRLPYR